jgi:hypothetical protein
VRRVKRTIRALEKDPVPWAAAYARLLAAGLHHVGGSSAEALRDLARARMSFARFGSEHMVDVVDRARMLVESSGCLSEVEARLAGRGVARPARFAAMLAPAFR